MELTFFNASIVVLAEGHNPSILHPAFLRAQEIVPTDWEPSEPPICTPPFSVVKYQNRFVFTVENAKFQILDEGPADLRASPIAEYAGHYISTLPHVKYTAVGVNIVAVASMESASDFLANRFLNRSRCETADLKLETVGLNFVYKQSDGQMHLNLCAGEVKRTTDQLTRTGILVRGNYNSELKPEMTVEKKAVESIKRYQERFDSLKKAATDLLI